MITLHEIPIYAISSKTLSSRYEQYKESFLAKTPPLDEDTFWRCIDHETFPQRCWKHNHVVGSIDIMLDNHNVIFELYFPYPKVKRYDWRRSHKISMCNISANGIHFYVDTNMSNIDMQSKISDMLEYIAKDYIPTKWHVDRKAFDAIHPYIDYKSIFESHRNNGENL